MKKTYLPLALTFLVLSKLDAATFQISSNLDNSFIKTPASGTPGEPGYVAPVYSTTVESPFVGTLTISYDGSSALTNGSYALNSLSNFQLSVLFPGVNSGTDVTFNQSHLDFDIAGVYVQVVDGNFFFTNSASGGSGTSLVGNTWGGSANFINGNYLFTTQPLNNVTRMGFGNYVVEYNALYQLVDISTASTGIAPGQPGYSSGTTIYRGNYGNPTDNASAVPEPSALSLLAVGLGALVAMRRSRKAV
jgi:hypothetical protein